MAIYFDSGTGRKLGVEIRVTNAQGESLLPTIVPPENINKYGNFVVPKKEASNNFGELLACYTALKIALKLNEKIIYGDSQLVLQYWSKGRYNTKKLKKADTIKLIKQVAQLRQIFEENGGQLIKISGDSNPADLGFHTS